MFTPIPLPWEQRLLVNGETLHMAAQCYRVADDDDLAYTPTDICYYAHTTYHHVYAGHVIDGDDGTLLWSPDIRASHAENEAELIRVATSRI